jgi:hypothetical protein
MESIHLFFLVCIVSFNNCHVVRERFGCGGTWSSVLTNLASREVELGWRISSALRLVLESKLEVVRPEMQRNRGVVECLHFGALEDEAVKFDPILRESDAMLH